MKRAKLNKDKITALYCRFSKDDGTNDESMSISTQKANLANAGMNPKALQYIIGHSNINMTLNYYAHATPDNAMAEMERLIA